MFFVGACIVGVCCSTKREARLEGTKRATSVNVQLLSLQQDLRTGSISRDLFHSL